MKSTNNKGMTFTMEDFEKGLMLAGYISPCSIMELNEQIELETYEKELKKENQNIFFKRVVLAAEIASQLHEEPTFGRVKFQKLIYLCEHAAQMKLEERYSKQVAGPFDNKFMHSIEKEFRSNKWFEVQKVQSGNISRSKYVPLEKMQNYKPYFISYFGDQRISIQKIIDLFRKSKTDTAEIAATLFACQLRLRNNEQTLTLSELLNRFYDWSEEKKRFGSEAVENVWRWMVLNGLVTDINNL